jgi:hypothetical protein
MTDEKALFEQGLGIVGSVISRITRNVKMCETSKDKLQQLLKQVEEAEAALNLEVASQFVAVDLLRAGASAQISRMSQIHEAELNEIVSQSFFDN